MKSTYSELHEFYVNVVNYPMKRRLVDSCNNGQVDELYTFLPPQLRVELKMVPDAMDNIVARLTVNESYVNAPNIFVSETNPDLAKRANWVQFLITNRLILSGGVVRDLPQLIALRDYDRIASTALVMIASVYICAIYKRAEPRVSVCDQVLTLAASQLDGLFPPAFDHFLQSEDAGNTPITDQNFMWTLAACICETITRGRVKGLYHIQSGNERQKCMRNIIEHLNIKTNGSFAEKYGEVCSDMLEKFTTESSAFFTGETRLVENLRRQAEMLREALHSSSPKRKRFKPSFPAPVA
ncbi:hypothetical protein CYMTET_8400 [Cymbomonas tetramitiformis]|uniref:Uncharacterized protein n=1 Tax=Cymbomonas tetramitiformis TaxID=36881 RepID=A0AAE0GTA5_9CHLO|nr:hypothetical protein CYMTET_8400 [Cymbomonas tetramitiformis]